MAISPFSEPVQMPQLPQPQQRLPLQQIAGATQRLQERHQRVQDRLGQVFQAVAEAETAPWDRTDFEVATQNIRQGLEEIAQSDRSFNKLPEVNRLAREFAETYKTFAANRENVQKMLDQIDERVAEGEMDPTHAEAQRQRIIQNARQNRLVNEEGMVQPENVIQPRTIGVERNPQEFLREVVDPEPRRREQGDFEVAPSGLMRREVFEGVTMEQARQQALDAMGITRGEDGSLQMTGQTDPGVQTWIRNRTRTLQQQGFSPEEANKRVSNQIMQMVNAEARTEVEGGTEFEFRSPPASETESGDTGVLTSAIQMPGVLKSRDPTTRAAQEEVREDVLSRALQAQGISRDQYRDMVDMYKSGVPSQVHQQAGTTGAGAGVIVPTISEDPESRSAKQRINEKYGPGAFAAFENIQQSVAEGSQGVMRHKIIRPRDPNTMEDWTEITSGHLESITEVIHPDMEGGSLPFTSTRSEKERAFLRPGNFDVIGVTNDGSEVIARVTEDGAEGSDIAAGETVRMRLESTPADEVPSLIESLAQDLPPSVRDRIMANYRVRDDGITREWTDLSHFRGVDAKLSGTMNTGSGEVAPAYEYRIGEGDRMTPGDWAQAIVEGQIRDEEAQANIFDQVAAHATMAEQRLHQQGELNREPPVNLQRGRNVLSIIQGLYGDQEMTEEDREYYEKVFSQPMLFQNPGMGASFAQQLQTLKGSS